jgi:hypothetical protein
MVANQVHVCSHDKVEENLPHFCGVRLNSGSSEQLVTLDSLCATFKVDNKIIIENLMCELYY